MTKGFDCAFLAGAGFAVLGAILAALLISSRDSRQHAQSAQSVDESGPAIAAG